MGGYSGDGFSCVDNNECTDGTNNCSPDSQCTNTVGAYTCTCNEGFFGNGIMCTDYDECKLGTSNCHADATCTNTKGSFLCTCNTGYTGDGVTCRDIDECDLEPCPAEAVCINNIGSYQCKCRDGYALISEGGEGSGSGPPSLVCEDINECSDSASNNCHPTATCVNTVGNYTCNCPNGFLSDGVACAEPLLLQPGEKAAIAVCSIIAAVLLMLLIYYIVTKN